MQRYLQYLYCVVQLVLAGVHPHHLDIRLGQLNSHIAGTAPAPAAPHACEDFGWRASVTRGRRRAGGGQEQGAKRGPEAERVTKQQARFEGCGRGRGAAPDVERQLLATLPRPHAAAGHLCKVVDALVDLRRAGREGRAMAKSNAGAAALRGKMHGGSVER